MTNSDMLHRVTRERVPEAPQLLLVTQYDPL